MTSNEENESTISPVLELQKLSKAYGDLQVLRGIDLQANQGEVISIIGPSGSGKSTLLRCINLLEMPNGGVIKLDGNSIALKQMRNGSYTPANKNQLKELRAKTGFVFQSFNLWPGCDLNLMWRFSP